VRTAVKAVRGRIPLLAGAGFCSRVETEAFVKEAGMLDIDGFLVILPTYFPVGFSEAVDFYRAVAARSKKPVFYYHYPQMTGLFYPAGDTVRLISQEGIAGIKESSLNLGEVKRHLKARAGGDFTLFSGNSFTLLKVLEMGGAGTICQVPSFAPKLVVACYDAWKVGDKKKAGELQRRIVELIPFLNSFAMPAAVQRLGFHVISRLPFPMKGKNRSRHAVIKETLRQLGHPVTATVRSPLPQITAEEREIVAMKLRELEIS
ncbi:MAG: dihydrodipicolinate synthase family protein, partial [Spirochaetes bacterium]|nr:dihydrodipicolinate synthase family protein [Spirochaetota bacterium]